MTAVVARPGPLDQRRALLDEVAVSDLDTAAARARLEVLAGRRRRATRGVVAAGVVSLLAVVGAFMVLGGEDPDELVADRDDRDTSSSTTTTRPRSTTTQAPPTSTPAPTSTAPSTTTTVVVAPSVAPAPAPAPTVAPNRPLQAQLRVLTPTVAAGDTATIEVGWIDEDHPGGSPELVVDWGDPAVRSADGWSAVPGCDTPGAGGGGVLGRQFRFASTGEHVVRVELRTCGGRGRSGETIVLTGRIRVTAPEDADGAMRAVVATVERRADGLPVLAPLDEAVARFVPDDEAREPFELAPRAPVLSQLATRWPATVLVLPADAEGTLELSWNGSACRAVGALAPSPPGAEAPVIVLSPTC